MSVLLIFNTEFGIHYLHLGFGTVHFLALVDKVLDELPAFEVNQNLPALIAIKDIVDELQPCDL